MNQRWAVKPTADRILGECEVQLRELAKQGVRPHLAVVLIGDDPASHVYVRNKVKTCEALGMGSTFRNLPATTGTDELLAVVDDLNHNAEVHGILVQLPLPAQIDESRVIAAIDPDKDVDGFHPVNVGRLSLGSEGLFPCTPMGIMALLEDSDLNLSGARAVMVGRSNIVGKPMAQLLLKANCTVTIIHSRTLNPREICRQADLLVVAIGKAGLIDASYLKPGAYVVDVGMNELRADQDEARRLLAGSPRLDNLETKGRVLYGDVHYESAIQVAAKVTPVPGGVGKLTIAQLMANCVLAAKRGSAK